jgi:hypothetical protein
MSFVTGCVRSGERYTCKSAKVVWFWSFVKCFIQTTCKLFSYHCRSLPTVYRQPSREVEPESRSGPSQDEATIIPEKSVTYYISQLFTFHQTSAMANVASALQKLATFRSQNNRASQETFDKGVIVLKSNVANKMGEEGSSHFRLQQWLSDCFCRMGFLGTTCFSGNRCRKNRRC